MCTPHPSVIQISNAFELLFIDGFSLLMLNRVCYCNVCSIRALISTTNMLCTKLSVIRKERCLKSQYHASIPTENIAEAQRQEALGLPLAK